MPAVLINPVYKCDSCQLAVDEKKQRETHVWKVAIRAPVPGGYLYLCFHCCDRATFVRDAETHKRTVSDRERAWWERLIFATYDNRLFYDPKTTVGRFAEIR